MGKKFLILGNMNAVTYKEVFPLMKENKLWWGCSTSGSARNMWFECPSTYEVEVENDNYKEENGRKFRRVQGIEWFTNLDHKKRHEQMDLYRKYNEVEYPKYDNYDAIEVSKVCDIPMDYDGVMGVPITFLDKYCPEQFEVLGYMASHGKVPRGIPNEAPYLNGKWLYNRILIRRK